MNNPTHHTHMTHDPRTARFQASMTANALERIAQGLDRLSATKTGREALRLEEYASELAHHADALREAVGLNADTEANIARLIANA